MFVGGLPVFFACLRELHFLLLLLKKENLSPPLTQEVRLGVGCRFAQFSKHVAASSCPLLWSPQRGTFEHGLKTRQLLSLKTLEFPGVVAG